ncbi:MAG: WG repeat-containing protein [Cytophagaceae bacterium]|nr:WG repeat-containing protein [Cytophagaceae bacterium]
MKSNIFSIIVLLVFPMMLNAQQPAGNWERTWEIKPGIYKVMQQGLVGVVNSDGEILVPCRFNQVYSLTDDNYVKVLENLKIGMYHLEKGMILPAEYDQIWGFEGETAKILKDGKTGYVNRNGFVVIPVEYNHIWLPDKNGFIKVLKNGKMGLLDATGAIVLPVEYQQIWSFDNGRAKVLKNGKLGYIDSNGNEIIPPAYDQLSSFNNGVVKAWIGVTALYIDTLGRTVEAPPQSDAALSSTSHTDEDDGELIYKTNDGRVGIRQKGNEQEIIIRKDDNNLQRPQIPDYLQRNKKRYFESNLAGITFGVNGYLNPDFNEMVPDAYSFMDINYERSFEISIIPFQHSTRLIGSYMGLVTAIGLRYNNYRFNLYNSSELSRNETAQGWFYQIPANVEIEKAKMSLISLDVPLMLEFHLPDGRSRNGIYLAGGVVGSLKLNTHTKVIYINSEGIGYKHRQDKDIGLNVFRYSLMARAGFQTFGIYATYSPMPLFKKGKGPELYPFSVGLTLNF